MLEVSIFDYGLEAKLNFEPPIPVRDDEPRPFTLPRLATIAALGTDYPPGMADQGWEEDILSHLADANDDPEAIAETLNTILDGERVLFEGTVDEHTIPKYTVTVG